MKKKQLVTAILIEAVLAVVFVVLAFVFKKYQVFAWIGAALMVLFILVLLTRLKDAQDDAAPAAAPEKEVPVATPGPEAAAEPDFPVYVIEDASVYHTDRDCISLTQSSHVHQTMLSAARREGRRLCKICEARDEEENA